MPALLDDREQPRIHELREMGACRWRSDFGCEGQLRRGEGATVEQRVQDIGARRISNERGDFGHRVRACDHDPMISLQPLQTSADGSAASEAMLSDGIPERCENVVMDIANSGGPAMPDPRLVLARSIPHDSQAARTVESLMRCPRTILAWAARYVQTAAER